MPFRDTEHSEREKKEVCEREILFSTFVCGALSAS